MGLLAPRLPLCFINAPEQGELTMSLSRSLESLWKKSMNKKWECVDDEAAFNLRTDGQARGPGPYDVSLAGPPCYEDRVLLKPSLFSFHPHLALLQHFQFAELIFLAPLRLWLVVHWLFISFFNFFQCSWNIFKPVSCGDIWGWFPWDLGEAGIMFSCKNRISYSRTLKNIVIIIYQTTGKIQTCVWDHPSFIMFTKIDALSFWGVWGAFDDVLFVCFLRILKI